MIAAGPGFAHVVLVQAGVETLLAFLIIIGTALYPLSLGHKPR